MFVHLPYWAVAGKAVSQLLVSKCCMSQMAVPDLSKSAGVANCCLMLFAATMQISVI
jgi:hypothetical protein